MAALLTGAVAGVGDVAVAPAGDLGGVAQVGEAHQVVAGGGPAGLGKALVLGVVHRPQELVGVEGRHFILAVGVAVAAEEPRLVAEDRATEGVSVVLGGELLGRAVLVLGHQVAVLEEVVGRAVEGVAARLGDDVRDEAGGADELGRDAAGDDLLLLDDLGVQVGAEGAGDRVGHVHAVEVEDVVGRDADGAADVAVVHARARGRIAGAVLVVGQHARHQLQVALVAAAGGQRLGELERDVLAGECAGHVDDRGDRGDRHRFGETGQSETEVERGGLPRTHQDLLAGLVLEALQVDRDRVLGRGRQRFEGGHALPVGDRRAAGDGVGGLGRHGDAGQSPAVGVGDHDLYRPSIGHLRRRGSGEGEPESRYYGARSNCHACAPNEVYESITERSVSWKHRASQPRLITLSKHDT